MALVAFLLLIYLFTSFLGFFLQSTALMAAEILFAGTALLTAAFVASRAQLALAWRIIRGLTVVATLPAAFIAFQLIPFSPLAHPIWANASSALGSTLHGTITVDKMETLRSLFNYLSLLAAIMSSLLISLDRTWAARMLSAILGLICILMLASLLAEWSQSSAMQVSTSPAKSYAFSVGGCALLLSISGFLPLLESRSWDLNENWIQRVAVPTCGISISLAVISQSGAAVSYVPLICASLVLIFIGLAHWFYFRSWEFCALVTLLILIVTILLASGRAQDLWLTTFSTKDILLDGAGATARLQSDAGLLGTGAGTYASLLSMYEIGRPATDILSTTATILTIEYGRPALIVFVISGLSVAALLFIRALRRGRDWCYPAAAAGCILLTTLNGLFNAGSHNLSYAALIAVISGMGLGQSLSLGRQQS